MTKSDRRVRSRVFFTAFGGNGDVILRKDMSYEDYYGGGCKLIDDDAYRAKLGIARVAGEIYDSRGDLQQSFENRYNESGQYVGGKAVHADGTVIEH